MTDGGMTDYKILRLAPQDGIWNIILGRDVTRQVCADKRHIINACHKGRRKPKANFLKAQGDSTIYTTRSRCCRYGRSCSC